MRLQARDIRPSLLAAAVLGALALLLAVLLVQARLAGAGRAEGEARQLVRALGLTDLALFTEARYTRHPSQADLATPFQDHPLALDHFPSASLVVPTPPAGGIVMRGAGEAGGAQR